MDPLFRISGEKIECLLCPHFCKIAGGKTGICRVRKNTGQKIELTTYGVISGYSLDPVEKKPLYHYFPGQNVLSIGSYGCNMRCDFCQNYQISQKVPANIRKEMSPEDLVRAALSATDNIGMAFTYNEPILWIEFLRDTAILIKNEGLKTIMVSNGFVNIDPLSEIISFIDAFNIDLKAFNNSSHKKLTGTDLDPVKKSLKQIARSGRHMEITSLIIPGHNDNEKEMNLQTEWIAGELGKEVPFHLSRYFPMFKRNDPPTSQETLISLFEIASEKLDFVYMGNTQSDTGHNTICPGCKTVVTYRSGFSTRLLNLDKKGDCSNCGTQIYKDIII